LLLLPVFHFNGSIISHWLSVKSVSYAFRLFSTIIVLLYHIFGVLSSLLVRFITFLVLLGNYVVIEENNVEFAEHIYKIIPSEHNAAFTLPSAPTK